MAVRHSWPDSHGRYITPRYSSSRWLGWSQACWSWAWRSEAHWDSPLFLPQDPAANTPDSVGLISVLLASDHQIDQPSVSRHFLLNIAPGIISTARNFKYFAHCLNRIGVAKPLMIRYFSFTFFQLLNSKIRSNSTYIRSFTSSF